MKVIDEDIVSKCRVYLTDARVPCVTVRDATRRSLYRCWPIDALDMPLLKVWPKITWIAVDQMVYKALRGGQPLNAKLLERLGMELVLSTNGCLTPVLSAYLEYFTANVIA